MISFVLYSKWIGCSFALPIGPNGLLYKASFHIHEIQHVTIYNIPIFPLLNSMKSTFQFFYNNIIESLGPSGSTIMNYDFKPSESERRCPISALPASTGPPAAQPLAQNPAPSQIHVQHRAPAAGDSD